MKCSIFVRTMIDKVKDIQKEIENFEVSTQEELEAYRQSFIGRKSKINALFSLFRDLSPEEKQHMGGEMNKLKNQAEARFKELIEVLENKNGEEEGEASVDVTLPGIPNITGTRHPLTVVREQIIDVFSRLGFNLSEGPEIEDDWHNFTALNFPENHPAREMQDTFFIKRNPDIALRTHTSSVQVRVMENQEPPIRTLSPGRVFRNEAISARAHCVFHQVEGLYIDTNVSFVDLKQTLYHFVREMFGEDTKMRFRPSYFPFTEPSAEIDISCLICGGEGCGVCKYSGWVEIGGAGMVDPNVLENSGIDPEKYSGFAFGMGIERITMLKYQIKDLRLFTENDVRFLRQFKPIG